VHEPRQVSDELKTNFFISHPVLTIVLSLTLVLAGTISILVLPIAKYPPVLPPTVEVRALYPGASAEVIEDTVTTWLEDAINGVPGMIYISSRSNNDGTCTITVTFELGYDVDAAELDILSRVTQVTPRLPAEVRRMGISVRKVSHNLVLSMMLYDEENRYSTNFLSNYAQIYMLDEMARVPGVGAVGFRGQRIYAMRIWLDPDELATRQLTASDVVAAIEDQNLTIPAGATGLPPTSAGVLWQRSVNTIGRLSSPEEFGRIVVKPGPANSVVRLSDVADIELGSNSYSTQSRFEGHKSVAIIFKPVPGANLVQMANDLRATVDKMRKDFPPGLKIVYPFDETIFIKAAIKEVVFTLISAIVLVGLVIFAFLRDWRSTLIPMITIPVSLLGTFVLMKAFGFSINLLTLFGLTLATGLVVDDAIVVVENINRMVKEKGISVIAATEEAMREVLGAVVASTLALVAVFVPCGFFPGVTGQLYGQFALTIACSLVLSLFTALTLAPAMAAKLLKSESRPPTRLGAFMERAFESSAAGYGRLLSWIIPMRTYVIIVFLGLLGLTAALFIRTPTGFLPDEDQGYFVVNVRAPTGTALAVTQEAVDKVTKKIESLPGVLDVMSLTGFSMIAGGGSNYGTIFANLKPWGERPSPEESAIALIEQLNRELMMENKSSGWSMMSMDPPSIQGLSAFGGFQLQVKVKAGGPLEELEKVTREIVGAANNHPKLHGVFSDFRADSPELFASIDREQALARGIPLSHIFETLQIFLSSIYVNDFNVFGRVYQVFVQARQDARAEPLDIPALYVRAANGEMVALRALVNLVPTRGSASIPHYNLDRSALIQGRPGPGVGSNEAIEIMAEIAERILPNNMAYEWTGMSLQAIKSGGLTPLIFMLGLTFVYLVLAAQYGSFIQPLIIMLVVPLAILGALLALWSRGLSSDIYAQVGFVMLIGLSTKNAILIVEVANQVRSRGGALVPATIEAAVLRFRPILMTTFAFAIGIFPMVVATGAGAASRQVIGTTVFGGIVISTILSLVLTPVLYVAIEGPRAGSSSGPGAHSEIGAGDDG
jgi:HAE1 family hydrophobic/amphiphilic exporter-1